MLDVLVIAPHPDDAEIGMGGTIALMRAEGLRVGILDLTDGEPTPRGSPAQRAAETAEATRVLGVEWRRCLGLPNRSLEPTLAARREVAGVLRQEQPHTLFAPYWVDVHPDHTAATALVEAARFWAKLTRTDLPGTPYWPRRLYYYFSIHLRAPEPASFMVDITPHIETKMQAIAAYRSQFDPAERGESWPTTLDEIRDRCRYWGWTIGTAWGEPFATRGVLGIRRWGALV